MYYAACCCDGPPPACNCDGKQFASVSFAVSFLGGLGPILVDECDRICRRNGAEAFHDLNRYYVEAKVYMGCGGSAIDTYYSTAALNDDQVETYDAQNLTILHIDNYMNFQIEERPFVQNCCDPPYDNECFTSGLRYFIDSRYCTLAPFDPYDDSINLTASTYVRRGDLLENAIPANLRDDIDLELDPARWYRKTKVAVSYALEGIGNEYRRDWSGSVESSTGPCGNNSPINNKLTVINRSLVRIADVGDECEPHNPGAEVVTYTESLSPQNIMIGFELPYTNVVVDTSTTNCPEQVESLDCCDDATVTSPAGETVAETVIGSEVDGGIFNLEFKDEPPPDLP